MPNGLTVRSATLADVPGIQRIHAQCEDPWADIAECTVWVNHRLLRGQDIDVAVLDGTIVGHAEWIVSEEPPPYGRHLYLGMLQVHAEAQRRGVGRAMIAAGAERARARGCPVVKTVPEREALGFYRACGFSRSRQMASFTAPALSGPLPAAWVRMPSAPRWVVRRLPMRLGVQGSSAHMWELCNRPVRVAGDPMYHPCARHVAGDAYVQLRYWPGAEVALTVAWAPLHLPLGDLIAVARALTGQSGVPAVNLVVEERDEPTLAGQSDLRHAGTEELWTLAVG